MKLFKKKLFKKKNWAYYLFVFGLFALAFFLVRIVFDHNGLRTAIIGGLVGGVVFTILEWFLDQGFKQVEAAAKEDEAERKRKEKTCSNTESK